MKSDRLKKIIIIIIIIAIIVGAIIAIRNGKKPSKQESQDVETVNSIILSLKEGYGTPYDGIELLYEEDKVTYDTLSTSNILFAATRYILEKGLDNSLEHHVTETLEKEYGYSIEKYTPYKGAAIRQAIKELFGKDFEDQSATNEVNFLYDFIYVDELDVYLKKRNDTYAYETTDYHLKTKAIKTTKSSDKFETEIAVAYVQERNNKFAYSNTVDFKEIIVELDKLDEIPDKEIDNFSHYIITLKKSGNNYIFESITKK